MNLSNEFSLFGNQPLFFEPKPLGCLYQPDIDKVLDYSKIFYKNKRYTNDGELTILLEKRLAKLHRVKHAIVFANGFLAILLTIKALALPGKTEVIVPSLAYRKLDDIIAWAGLIPRYCDIDLNTLTASVESIENSITENTALILVQNSSVGLVDINEIRKKAKKYGIPVINDSALFFGKTNNEMVGANGDAEIFLLNATKFINGFEGGYVTTNDDLLASTLATTRRFGFTREDNVDFGASLNAKLNEVHAASALAFLDNLDKYIINYKEQFMAYKNTLEGIEGIDFIGRIEDNGCYFRDMGMMILLTDKWLLTREETISLLNAEGILARNYYFPLHLKDVGYKRITALLPNTHTIHDRLINLPQGAHVSICDIYKICEFIKKIKIYESELKKQLRGMNNEER